MLTHLWGSSQPVDRGNMILFVADNLLGNVLTVTTGLSRKELRPFATLLTQGLCNLLKL